MKLRVFSVLVSLFCAVNLTAQSFDSLKKKKASSYNVELDKLLEKNDVEGMAKILSENPAMVNDATKSIERNRYRSKIYYENVPLINDAIDRLLKGNLSVQMCEVIIKSGCDLKTPTPIIDKPPIYLLLDFIATHKKEICTDAEKVLEAMVNRSDFDINQRYQTLLPPLAYLIRENHAFLGKFSSEYISDNVIRIFIEKGASVHTFDAEGNSLMAFATQTNNDYVQSFLVDKGIDVTQAVENGKDAVYKTIENGKISLLKQILDKGYDLNINTLKNNPDTFRKNKEMYDYIVDLCAKKAENYEDIILFREKFPEHKVLVQTKYERLATTCSKDAMSYEDIMVCLSKFPDMTASFKPKLSAFYKNDCLILEKIKNKIFALTEKGYVFIEKDNFVDRFITSYSSYDPDNKRAVAQELSRVMAVSEIISRPIRKEYLYYSHVYEERRSLLGIEYNVAKISGVKKPQLDKGLLNSHINMMTSAINLCRKPSMTSLRPFFIKAEEILIQKHDDIVNTYNKQVKIYNKEISFFEERNAQIEAMEREKELKEQEECKKCAIDFDHPKNRLPRDYTDFLGFSDQNPGRIYMKNGDYYLFWRNSKGKWLIKGFIFDDTFEDYNDLLDHFIKKCQEEYCN